MSSADRPPPAGSARTPASRLRQLVRHVEAREPSGDRDDLVGRLVRRG